VQLDSFPGTDDQKLTAAMAYAAQQPMGVAIQFPARKVTLSQTGRVPYNGMTLLGPGGSSGPKDIEVSAKCSTHVVQLNVSTNYSIYIADLAFQGSAGAQFWNGPYSAGANLYSCQFHALSFLGFSSVFGNAASSVAFTGVVLSGTWVVEGAQDTSFHIGGSDSELWRYGYLNIDSPSGQGGGKYQVVLDTLGKTNVGRIYVTSESGGWRGVKVTGNSRGLNFWGSTSEGRNAGAPCDGTNWRIEGGQVGLHGIWTAYGMNNPASTEHGIIEVTGGNVLVDRPVYDRGNAPLSVPLLYVSGGKAEIRSAAMVNGETPVVHAAPGSTLVTDSSVTVI
jgi:hypothetical protein